MGEFCLAPEAEADLDGIWLRIARESGSIDIANRVLDNITKRFGYWRSTPTSAAAAMIIGVLVCEASRPRNTLLFIASSRTTSY